MKSVLVALVMAGFYVSYQFGKYHQLRHTLQQRKKLAKKRGKHVNRTRA